MKTKLVNLTPHPVRLLVSRWHYGTQQMRAEQLVIQPDPRGPAHVQNAKDAAAASIAIDGLGVVQVVRHRHTITGLPDPEDGVLYLVSAKTALEARDRTDLVTVHARAFDRETGALFAHALRFP